MIIICNLWKIILLLLLLTSNSLAVPINYDESLEGDLSVSSFIYSGDAFTFSAGTNKISGQMTMGRDVIDFDTFFFIVQENMLLESITYSFSNVLNFNNYASSAGASYTLRNGIDNTYLGSSGRVDVVKTSGPISLYEDILPFGSDFTGLLPLDANTYLFGNSLFASSGVGLPYLVTWDYSIEFEVTSVSEPSTFYIFTLGLFIIFAAKYSANKSSNLTGARNAPSS